MLVGPVSRARGIVKVVGFVGWGGCGGGDG